MFGGIASHCYDLAYSLSKQGIETTVFTGKSKRPRVEKLNDNLKVVRLPFLDLPPRQLWFQIQNYGQISKLLTDYTIIHNQGVSSAFFVHAKNRIKKPIVSTIHSVPYYELKNFYKAPISDWSIGEFVFNLVEYPLNDYLTRIMISHSDHVIAVGHASLRHMSFYRNLPIDNVSVIPNGINFDKIESILAKSTLERTRAGMKAKPTIFFCGRLYWRKGIIHLVKAMSLLKDLNNIQLKIFGRGPLESKLKELVVKLGVKDIVKFEGHVPYPTLILALEKADVAVFPSLYEVGPFISALEAMACKKSPILFDFPFSREFVKNMVNGVLVEPGNVEDLADKMRLLLLDKGLREKLGERAYNQVKEKYNWDSLVEQYIELYDNLSTSSK